MYIQNIHSNTFENVLVFFQFFFLIYVMDKPLCPSLFLVSVSVDSLTLLSLSSRSRDPGLRGFTYRYNSVHRIPPANFPKDEPTNRAHNEITIRSRFIYTDALFTPQSSQSCCVQYINNTHQVHALFDRKSNIRLHILFLKAKKMSIASTIVLENLKREKFFSAP